MFVLLRKVQTYIYCNVFSPSLFSFSFLKTFYKNKLLINVINVPNVHFVGAFGFIDNNLECYD